MIHAGEAQRNEIDPRPQDVLRWTTGRPALSSRREAAQDDVALRKIGADERAAAEGGGAVKEARERDVAEAVDRDRGEPIIVVHEVLAPCPRSGARADLHQKVLRL